MLPIKEQIRKLKLEIPDIDKTLSDGNYSEEGLGKFEHFVSKVVSLAETVKDFKNSSVIARIRELQGDRDNYKNNISIIVANAKGLLDSLDVYFSH